jgi:hypothetical protein
MLATCARSSSGSPTSAVSPREAVCEREEPPNQLVAGRRVAEARVPPKQALYA